VINVVEGDLRLASPPDLSAEIAECLQDTQSPWGSSRFNLWHRCRKAHDLRHVQGLVSLGDRPKYFGIGSLTHAGINFLQRGVLAGEPEPRNWELVIEAAAAKLPGEICDEAWRLLSAYFAHYGTECAGWPEGSKILGAELYLSEGEEQCTNCGGYGRLLESQDVWVTCSCGGRGVSPGAFALPYTARADTVLQLPSGEIVIPDTKTRRSAFPEERQQYAQGLATRPQFTGLSWLVQRHLKLEEPPHIWVNAIVKTKIPKFDRLLVKMTPEGLAAWEHDHTDVAAAMRYEQLQQIEPLANRSECAPDMGSRCEYFDWCHGSDELRARKFTTRDAA
jgi:hypothetical protein